MAIESSIVGSSTKTVWNLLVNAASFSIYFLYSSSVVAPIALNSPRANAGFNIFDASIAPWAAPAPTKVWSSSIKRIYFPKLFSISFIKAFSRSSNSPLYFAPAIIAAKSIANTSFSFKDSGTSPFAILCAKPSTIAVLPTPASPIKTGLFFVLLDKICITLLISSSLPITGSNLPRLAKSVKLRLYFSIAWYFPSGSWSVTVWCPLIDFRACKILSLVIPFLFKIW